MTRVSLKDFAPGYFWDHHVHLGACDTPKNLWVTAKENGISLSNALGVDNTYHNFQAIVENTDKDADHEMYLNRFKLMHTIQSSPSSVEKSAFNAAAAAYTKSKIGSFEVRMNPILRNPRKEFDIDFIIFAALTGLRKAQMFFNMKCGLILEMDRSFSEELNSIIVNKAMKYTDAGVVGIDVSGSSKNIKNFNFDPFKTAYEFANNMDLNTTVHAGEVYGPEEIWYALEELIPKRIGHGIMAYKDEDLMHKLVDTGVVLEICPTSNLATKAVTGIDQLTKIITTFRDYGVKFTINSDGPVFLGTNTFKEINMLVANDIIEPEYISTLKKHAEESSFIP